MRWLVLTLLIAAPAARAAPAWVDATLLGAAETSLALDLLQTLDIKRHGFTTSTGTFPLDYETNPILGRRPGDLAVLGYFTAAMVLTGAAWYALPPRLRVLAPILVLALEVPQIGRNAAAGYSIRF